MRFPGFIGPSYKLRSVNVDCQRTINLYPEIDELGTGKDQEVAAFIGTPGKRTLFTVPNGPIRASYTSSKGVLYVVGKDKLYKVSSVWGYTLLGTLNTISGPVSIADNGIQLLAVDGDSGYYVTMATDVFAEITDPDFPAATHVSFQDGYFILNVPDTGQFVITDLNGVGVDPLDIATSEGNPDSVVAHLSDHRDLWMFNERSIEIFYNSGDADFPFTRVQGAFIEHGCAAAFSVAKMNNTVFWLGQDDKGTGMVFMAKGYQPQRISTHAVEQAIQSYDDISDAEAWTYQQDGHHFYALNFPSADTTWVFDSSTNLWHERAYNNNGVLERDRAANHAFAYGTHVVGDYENGNVYALETDYYSDAGVEIIRRRVTPHISKAGKRIFYQKFELDVESGVGLDGTGQGTDPLVMMRFSDDGGHTWSNEKTAAIGKIGQTKWRAKWHRLGQARDRVFMISISDPVKVVIVGANLDLKEALS